MTNGLPDWATTAPEVLGVHVRHYKNLHDLWLRWEPRMVLLGANGVGKTNLLECCALLMGTDETKRLVARRVPDHVEFDISVVVKGDRLAFPLDDYMAITGWGSDWPGAAEEEEWLVALDAREGEELKDSVGLAAEAAGAPDETLGVLVRAMHDATVRWRLQQSSDGERTWTRTLVSRERITEIEARDPEQVPSPLRPLLKGWRTHTPRGHDPYTDLLSLPAREDVPVDLQWLPYLRTDLEIANDFNEALYAAAPGLGVYQVGTGFEATLISLTNDFIEGDEEEDVDATQWVVNLAAEAAQRQLELAASSLPHLKMSRSMTALNSERVERAFTDRDVWPEEGFVNSVASDEASEDANECLVSVAVGNAPVLGSIDQDSLAAQVPLVEVLSAGERRWFDEAMHAAATLIRQYGRLAAADTSRLYALWQHPEESGVTADTVRCAVKAAWALDGEWTPRAITQLLQTLAEPMQRLQGTNTMSQALRILKGLEDRQVAADVKRNHRMMMLGVIWDEMARTTLPRARVRVFDEPEAHMHSGAVGRLADGLHHLAEGADVLVSSHHARFVYSPGWMPYHLRRNEREGRVVLGTFDASLRDARTKVAGDLGLSRAESLAGAGALLLVEGDHDQRILQSSPFEQQFRSAGVVVLPLRGAYELASAALVEVLAELGPPTIGVMIDNGAVEPGRKASSELLTLRQFCDRASTKGIQVGEVLLSRPDIITYLNPEAVRRLDGTDELVWADIVRDYRQAPKAKFKDWLHSTHHIDLRFAPRIDRVLQLMHDENLPFEPELLRAVNTFLAGLSSGSSNSVLASRPGAHPAAGRDPRPA